MKNLYLIILTLLLSSFSINSYATHTSDPALVAQGAKLYSQNCGRCHNPRPASDYSKSEWSVVMPHMREKAHMTGKEALAVEAFLDMTLTSDVKNDMNKSDKPKVTLSGSELVAQFGCQGCHTLKGEGGSLGPNLDGVIDRRGVEFVLKKLANPKFNNSASAMPQFPFTLADRKAIAKFLSEK